jgi:UDP-glucose 4-epimerase
MDHQKVAITGGAGRLGRALVAEMRGRADITVIDRVPMDDGTPHHVADVTSFDTMRRLFSGYQAVAHLAAIPNPRTSTPDATFQTNVMAAYAVLAAAEEAGVRRVVVASSDSVLGLSYNPPDWQPHFLPIDESHPCRPTEFYSLSKQVTETIAQSYAARGRMEIVIIRPTHIVFPPEYPELAGRGSDVENYHFWTYVAPEDVAQSFRLALEVPKLPSRCETFLISADDGLNTRPTLDLVRARWGLVPELRKPSIYERLPTASLLDSTKAKDLLGYRPTGDWRRMKA